MQKIKVVKIERKPVAKGGTMTALFDDKGTRFSGFISELKEVAEGDLVEAEIEVDGKYNNIKAVKILEHSTTTAQSSDITPTQERASIEAQVAFKGIVDLLAASVIIPDSLKNQAFNWAACKLKDWNKNTVDVTKTKTEINTNLQIDSINPTRSEKPVEKVVFKNLGEFYKKIYDTYHLSMSEVQKIDDIISFLNQQKLSEAWEKLVELKKSEAKQ
jgi:hypothetical protein